MATHMSIHASSMGTIVETPSASIEFEDVGMCRGLVAGGGPGNPMGVPGGPEGGCVGNRMPGRPLFEPGEDGGSAGGAGTSRRRGTGAARGADEAPSSEEE